MKKFICGVFAIVLLTCPNRANSFTDGSGWVQVSYLIKLVEESIRHYYQLQQMIQQGRDAQNYMREINRGLEDSIRLLESLPIRDENILGQLRTFQRSIAEIERVYGAVPKSSEAPVQKVNDLAIAESLKMVASANDYAEKQETNAIALESRSWDMSPKGAARMQAQASSQILLTLNQILRMNAQLLKMQSAQAANHNREEKQDVLRFQRFAKEVRTTSKAFSGGIDLPKF
ncbi:MAG: hypothetical protein K2X47_16130 [Bdellovibrionales bacterium]|nr:hypothetical protein [Bdellovibrionales bacterium]